MFEDYEEDPTLGNEDDPEYKAELFESFREMGWRPEDLKDPQDQREYAEWLQNRETP